MLSFRLHYDRMSAVRGVLVRCPSNNRLELEQPPLPVFACACLGRFLIRLLW